MEHLLLVVMEVLARPRLYLEPQLLIVGVAVAVLLVEQQAQVVLEGVEQESLLEQKQHQEQSILVVVEEVVEMTLPLMPEVAPAAQAS
jgi:hypothetical protein